MRTAILLIAIGISSLGARAATDRPASIAFQVHEDNRAELVREITTALTSENPLVRATAARIASVRDLKELLPALRTTTTNEKETVAIIEELRALTLLGSDEDIDSAIALARKWPPFMDGIVASAVARRGGAWAIDTYLDKLKDLRTISSSSNFFVLAMWSQIELVDPTARRLLLLRDTRGWDALLAALKASELAFRGPTTVMALRSPSEPIAASTVWWLADVFGHEPSALPAEVVEEVKTLSAESRSDRESFGRELLRRLVGETPREDARWNAWLATNEADDLFSGDTILFTYLTLGETAIRTGRCSFMTTSCPKPSRGRQIPSRPVKPPEFALPDTLPAGLVRDILRATHCAGGWIGVATATVDRVGRVQQLNTRAVNNACPRALPTILKLSLATTFSMRSSFESDNVLVVKAPNEVPCLDEVPGQDESTPPKTEYSESEVLRVGGDVEAPVVVKRIEPEFPRQTIQQMGRNRNVLIILEALVSKMGCIRSIHLLSQSPYPELNAAAVAAISRWKFKPGRRRGIPVDVIFNLTINFIVP